MAKGTGVIDIESTYKVTSKLAPGWANEAPDTKKRHRKAKRAAVPVPAAKPITVGDTVISRDYFSGGQHRKLFAGTATVRTITTEQRRDLGSGKVFDVRRMTVITIAGQRYDVLEAMLKYVGRPAPAPEPAKPAPQPEPAPRAIMHPLPLAIMVVDVRRGRPVNTNTPPVIELPAYFGGDFAAEAQAARAAIRAEYERETGETLPERRGVDVGRRGVWIERPNGMFEKVKVK